MKARTKRFALRVMNLVDALPKSDRARVVGNPIAALWNLGGCKLSGSLSW